MFYILDGMINGNVYINEIFIYSAVDKIHIPNHCLRYYYFLERELLFVLLKPTYRLWVYTEI